MKTSPQIETTSATKPNFKQTCEAYCKKLLAQIKAMKEQLFAELKESFGAHDHLLQLALNEAEALAWQTEYPHLLFPQLATEKAEAAAQWDRRQSLLKRNGLSLNSWAVRRIDEDCKPIHSSSMAFA